MLRRRKRERGTTASPDTTIDEILSRARSAIERSEPRQVLNEMESGAVVVDLRCPEERRRTGMIPGSIAVARSVLEWRADPASPWRDDRIARRDSRLLLLCEQGYSSSLAAESLHKLGFTRAGDIVGGMERWLEEGRPVEPAPD